MSTQRCRKITGGKKKKEKSRAKKAKQLKNECQGVREQASLWAWCQKGNSEEATRTCPGTEFYNWVQPGRCVFLLLTKGK